jgi:VWFA-related protein
MSSVPRLSRRLFLFSGASLIARGQEPIFTSGVQVVNVLATVRDKKGAILSGLKKDDFTILEDGRAQKISYFTAETNLPLTIGLLIDTSISQTKMLDAERAASFRFVDQVLRENKDHVFIMQFDLAVQTPQPLTSSRNELSKALTFVDTPTRNQLRSQIGGGTLLYDAIVEASEDIMKKQQGRKALIVLSDGGENGSDATLTQAIEAALRAETLIYSIFYSDGSYGNSRGIMRDLAKNTGGGYFEVSKKFPIDQVYAVIEEDLRNQYSLGFVTDRPTEVSQFRKLQLAVDRPGMVVQSRDRYWAGPGQ